MKEVLCACMSLQFTKLVVDFKMYYDVLDRIFGSSDAVVA